jgi:hypothetical protein
MRTVRRHGRTPGTGIALAVRGDGSPELDRTSRSRGSVTGTVALSGRRTDETVADGHEPVAAGTEDRLSLPRSGGR